MIDVDFSLAIHNRTGKYFIGRDIIADNTALIATVLYGRMPRAALPDYLTGRLAGRLLKLELERRAAGKRGLPRVRRTNPVLHMDPLTALNYHVSPCDIVIVHDVGPVTHPDLFPADVTALYQGAYDHIVASRPLLVFVSEASRTAFGHLYRFDGQTCVIYPQIRAELKSAVTPVSAVTTPFLLTVGSIGARKGQAASIAGYARSGLHQRGVSYVICGGPEEPGHAAAVAAARTTPGVIHLPYVSDGELSWLYRNATGFVLASRLEGFGVPVAEAISYGLMPAVTADSVLEEVAGPDAIVFDGDNEQAIGDAMVRLVDMSDEERARRLQGMTARIGSFSPEVFAQRWAALLATRA